MVTMQSRHYWFIVKRIRHICHAIYSYAHIWCPPQLEETPPHLEESPHYGDDIMDAIASQITSLTIVYSTVYSDADQRKHQSSASLAFVRGIHRGPANSPHKWPVTRKMFPFDDVIMSSNLLSLRRSTSYLVEEYEGDMWNIGQWIKKSLHNFIQDLI